MSDSTESGDELPAGVSKTEGAPSDDEFGDCADAPERRRATEHTEAFAEAVMAARGRSVVPAVDSPAHTGWSPTWGVVAVAAAVAGVLLFGLRQQSLPATMGATTATQRQQVELGHRGVAVLESGARIEWRVDSGGNARVYQARGDVFYRVNRGGRFVVATDRGNVSVTGTCFRLVRSGSVPLALDVLEGRVSFASIDGSTRRVEVGQHLEIDKLGAVHVSTRGAVIDGERSL